VQHNKAFNAASALPPIKWSAFLQRDIICPEFEKDKAFIVNGQLSNNSG
jgi:hypothetical protein